MQISIKDKINIPIIPPLLDHCKLSGVFLFYAFTKLYHQDQTVCTFICIHFFMFTNFV